jgi:5-hydroxyisourate hydrolase-like protein (transthyretin family)
MKLFSSNFFIYPLFIITISLILLYFQTHLFTYGQTQIFPDIINATVNVEKPKIFPNETQMINVQVFDTNTNETISLAYVDLIVRDNNNFITRIYSGLTNENGKFSYAWKIDENAQYGTYNVTVDIIATGYKSLAKTETFAIYSVNGSNNT